ncbi:hypothetical protein [uncultured Kordia sp.]|uniref:hypothetical protein n=1 Tax=uncultured Kordia sp. TaxID=507699 RepID=UPI00262DF6BC|nr:hypothetical protein [uncultured Kordia sp.]
MNAVGQNATKKDWIKFTLVMIIFMIGMILMIMYKIKNIWLWIGYITVWTWAEMKIAKKIQLKWWVWMFILLMLSVIDLIIIKLIPH